MPRTNKITKYQFKTDKPVIRAILGEFPCEAEINPQNVTQVEVCRFGKSYQISVFHSDSEEEQTRQ